MFTYYRGESDILKIKIKGYVMSNRPLRLINQRLETICYLEVLDTTKNSIMVVTGIVNSDKVFNLLDKNGISDLLNYIKSEYGYVWNSIKSPRIPNQSILESLRLESRLINQDETAPDNIIMLF